LIRLAAEIPGEIDDLHGDRRAIRR
jgi:hypothetical protein